MVINILSREVVPATLSDPTNKWKFYISAADATQVIFYWYTLKITTTLGDIYPSLTTEPWSQLYITATMDPYGGQWKVEDNGSGIWSLTFLKPINAATYAPAFTDIKDWRYFVIESAMEDPVTVDLIATPQSLTPAYNPITFKFSSPQYDQPSFRYIVRVYSDNFLTDGSISGATELAKFKVAPNVDGLGYVDVSKVVNNLTTYNFEPGKEVQGWVPNTLVKYNVSVGVEFVNPWVYTSYQSYGIGINANKMLLVQDSASTPHTYVIGDQINIDTTENIIRGLHTVIETPTAYSIVIDTVYTGVAQPISGVINYADGRSVRYPDISLYTGYAFNGSREWVQFPKWLGYQWIIGDGFSYPLPKLLTSLKPADEILDPRDNVFYVRPWQTFLLNFFVPDPDQKCILEWEYVGTSGTKNIQEIGASGLMKGFRVGFDALEVEPIADVPLVFRLLGDVSQPISKDYILYPDMRCDINEYELMFMDRMGSILSFPMSLRDKQRGSIDRNTYKKAIIYNETNVTYDRVYDIKNSQVITNSLTYDKELELNTNWLNDGMSQLWEELMTSPYVWIKMNLEPIIDNDMIVIETVHLPCTIKEKSFEVERQKNKRLIKKNVTVTLSNQNIVNI